MWCTNIRLNYGMHCNSVMQHVVNSKRFWEWDENAASTTTCPFAILTVKFFWYGVIRMNSAGCSCQCDSRAHSTLNLSVIKYVAVQQQVVKHALMINCTPYAFPSVSTLFTNPGPLLYKLCGRTLRDIHWTDIYLLVYTGKQREIHNGKWVVPVTPSQWGKAREQKRLHSLWPSLKTRSLTYLRHGTEMLSQLARHAARDSPPYTERAESQN